MSLLSVLRARPFRAGRYGVKKVRTIEGHFFGVTAYAFRCSKCSRTVITCLWCRQRSG